MINLSVLKASLVSSGKYSGDLCFCSFNTEDLAEIFSVDTEDMKSSLQRLIEEEKADFIGDLGCCGTITFYDEDGSVTTSKDLVSDLVTSLSDKDLTRIINRLPKPPVYDGTDKMEVFSDGDR